MSGKWSEEAWESISGLYSDMLQLPFLREMADGSLSPERFQRYLKEDTIYLSHYATHMLRAAQLLKGHSQQELFKSFAQESLEAEKELHIMLANRFNISKLSVSNPSVVTEAYTALEDKALASGNTAIAVAALLPCTWIYNEVSRAIAVSAKRENNPYDEWLATYRHPSFSEGTALMTALADELAQNADERTKKQMTEYFKACSLLEYAFWDYAYNGDTKDYKYIHSL